MRVLEDVLKHPIIEGKLKHAKTAQKREQVLKLIKEYVQNSRFYDVVVDGLIAVECESDKENIAELEEFLEDRSMKFMQALGIGGRVIEEDGVKGDRNVVQGANFQRRWGR